jgi:hypothetical protein
VDEMHKLGGMLRLGAKDIEDYLTANYSPTLPEVLSERCVEDHGRHFFVVGAVHICQTMGVSDARQYTCEECMKGLEWAEAYLEDPIMVAEYVVYLQQNF